MNLKVYVPTGPVLDLAVLKVIAEAQNGSFCLLPRHIDFVAALVPGLLAYSTVPDGEEEFLAVDEGVLVKVGPEVVVSVLNAVRGPDLGVLRQTIEEQFEAREERERRTRAAMARLESGLVRRFVELSEQAR